MIVFKVFVYAAAGLGWLFIFAVFVGKAMALGNRQCAKPRLTVIWRDTDVMFQAFTGYVEPLGTWHIKVTNDDGWPVVVDRRDIVEVR